MNQGPIDSLHTVEYVERDVSSAHKNTLSE